MGHVITGLCSALNLGPDAKSASPHVILTEQKTQNLQLSKQGTHKVRSWLRGPQERREQLPSRAISLNIYLSSLSNTCAQEKVTAQKTCHRREDTV